MALSLGGAALALEKPPPELAAPRATSVMRAAHGVVQVDGELWGVGPDYKALFREGGFELTPALGRAAPRSLPLAFELESIERGGVLVLAPAAPAAPSPGAGESVRYAHPGGIEERYEVRADGVEQSFVFAEPLPGAGELVVRGRLSSELAAPLGEHEVLDFTLPGLGGVRFGAVAGVDAAGRTASGSLRYDGSAVELVLPAAFVDAAAYPLVLDPLIGVPFVIPAGGTFDESGPDVAYDRANSLYLVAWHREFSASDFDVYAQRVSTSGSPVGAIIVIENGFAFATSPTVANVSASRRFLVAWQERSGGSYDIKARAVWAIDGSTSPVLTLAAFGEDELGPDAAGEQTLDDDDAFVVWERDGVGIFAAQVSLPVLFDPWLVSLHTIASDPGAYQPAIAKSMGTNGRVLIAYTVAAGPGDTGVKAVLYDRNGFLIEGPLAWPPTADSELDPDVDGDGTSWVLAYVLDPSGSGDREIACRKVVHSSFLSTLIFTSAVAITSDTVDNLEPAVAWTPGKVFVAWRDQVDLFNTDVYAKGIDPESCAACEAKLPLAVGSAWDGEVELASQYSAGSTGDQVFAAWTSGIPGFPSVDQTDIKGQLLEAFGPGDSVLNLGGGCGTGGSIGTSGPTAAGNPAFAVTLSGADPLATTALLVLHPPAAPYVCGGCSVILPGSLFTVPLSGGAASMTLPIPCDVALIGAQLDAQWAVLPTSSVSCPLFGLIAASAALRLTVGQ